MASVHLVPRDGTDIRATLSKLQANFDLADAVIEALEKSQLKNLEEFRFLFDSEAEIGIWIARLKLGDQEQLQVARLRRTWSAVKLFYQHAEQDRSKVHSSDFETLLGDTELRDIKTAFWARYRLRFPPEMYPSDATLSRISCELSKRMLCVFSVWKVKSLQFQLVTTSKKRKLSENLFTEELQEDEPVVHDWENYLDRLQILLLAYALAGVHPLSSAPPSAQELALGVGLDGVR